MALKIKNELLNDTFAFKPFTNLSVSRRSWLFVMTWKHSQESKKLLKHRKTTESVLDSRWSWIVMIASGLGMITTSSFAYINGLLYTSLVDEFGFDFSMLTLIGSVHLAIEYIGAIFSVKLIEKFDVRPVLLAAGILQFIGCLIAAFVTNYYLLFLSLSIIFGIGNALAYVGLIVAIDKYFDKKKSIAMTLGSLGNSFGGLIFTPLVEFLLQKYGFNGTMMIYSSVMLNTLTFGSVVFPTSSRATKTSSPQPQSEHTDMKFCKRPVFMAYLMVNLLYVAGLFIPYGIMPTTAISRGVDSSEISLAMSVNAILQVLGRLLFGYLAFMFPSKIKCLWSLTLLGFAGTLLIIPFANVSLHFMAYNIVNGVFNGGANLGYNLALKNIVEPINFGRAISLGLMMQGVGALTGNPLAALLQDVTGNGDVPYYLGFGLFFLSGILLLPFKNSDPKQYEYEQI